MALVALSKRLEWYRFCLRYQHDLFGFAIEVLGVQPTWQQKILFQSISIAGSRTSVASGHGTGKTMSAGITALWHLLCFHNSIMLFTAPQINQLKKQVWKEIGLNLDRLRANPEYAWLAEYVVFQSDLVYIRGETKQLDAENKSKWCVKAKTAPKHSPTNIAGEHGDNYMLWGDEACGIDDEVMNVVMGALTHADNRAVLTSQPARGNGFFFDTHHKLSYKVGGEWISLTFNGELSPIVSPKSLREQLLKYGSRDDPQYKIRVRGEFPERLDEFIITTSMVDDTYKGTSLKEEHQEYGYIISVDVGGGVGRDDSVVVVAKIWGEQHWGRRARRIEVIDIPMCKNTGDSANIFGVINECLVTYDNAMVVADTNGVGNELGKMLQQAGIYYKPVKWGGACFNNENKKLYANLRTQAYVCLGRAMKDGRFKMKTRKYANKYQDQMIKIPYSFDDQYRYKLKSKGDMAKEGIKSPDLGDALAFLFLEGVSYSVADSNKQSDELGTQRSERQQQFAQLQGVDISNL